MRRTHLLIVFLVALAPRLILWGMNLDHPERWYTPDSKGYRNLGVNLLHHGVLSQNDGPSLPPDYQRTPIYPMFLAAVYAVSGDSDAAALFVQILLSAATAPLLVLVAAYFVGPRWALVAGYVQAVGLSGIVSTQFILTETLFTFLLVIQLWLVLRYRQKGRWGELVAATVCLAIMALCRPISLPWIVLQAIYLLLEFHRPWRARLVRVGASVLIFAMVLSPWLIRNKVQDGHFYFSSMNLGYQFLNYHAPAILARETGEPAPTIRKRLNREVNAEFANHPERYDSEYARGKYISHHALSVVGKYPVQLAAQHFRVGTYLPRVNSFFELTGMTSGQRGTLDVLNREGLAAAVRHYFGGQLWLVCFVIPWLALLGLVYAGAVLGVGRWILRWDWRNLLLFGGFALFYVILPASASEPRFREPAMPMFIIAAVVGFAGCTEWFICKRRNSRDGERSREEAPASGPPSE